MFKTLIIMLAVLTLASCASSSEQSSSSGQIASNSETSSEGQDLDPNEVICTREAETGSYVRRRVCMTRAQRDSLREDTNEFLNNSRDRAGSSNASDSQ